MKKFSLLIFCACSIFSFAGTDPQYPVALIPAEISKNSNAVVRDYSRTVEFINSSTTVEKYHVVITILNQSGSSLAEEVVYYDSKSEKVTEIRGNIYDAIGLPIKKLKQSDIADIAAISESTIQSSGRFKVLDLSHGSYPYTVEYSYVIEAKRLFMIDTYYPFPDEKVGIQKSRLEVKYPADMKVRIKEVNIAEKPVVKQDKLISVVWEYQNKPCVILEPYGEHTQVAQPHIMIAPTQFNYDNYAGNMESWENFGQWISNLNAGRDVLPQETVEKVKQLTQNLSTPEAKAKVLYEYMQNKTRYVSIQLGIGGFQPFPAETVDRLGYGDCKALSNYMVALLKAAGIRAEYVLIRAGEDAAPIDTQFPSSQFNHAIAYVPLENDTLWMECTSQEIPFGYLGDFTSNRKALAITEKGGKIVRTETYRTEDNLRNRKINVNLTSTGDAQVNATTTYVGLRYDDQYLAQVLTSDQDTQRKWLNSMLDIPTYEIEQFNFSHVKSNNPKAKIELKLLVKKHASASDKRLFLPVNIMSRSKFIPERNESRQSGIRVPFGKVDIDTVVYTFPPNLYPEHVPAPQKVESRFGSYETYFSLDEGKLIYIRKFTRKQGMYPATTYPEFLNFYKDINKADNQKVVLLGKT